MTVTPLEILSLAHTRKENPDLALFLATEAGKQNDTEMKNERSRENPAGRAVAGSARAV